MSLDNCLLLLEAFHFDRKLVRSNYIESLIRDDEPGLHRNYYVG